MLRDLDLNLSVEQIRCIQIICKTKLVYKTVSNALYVIVMKWKIYANSSCYVLH